MVERTGSEQPAAHHKRSVGGCNNSAGEPGKTETRLEESWHKLDEVLEAESLLIGRVTYESFAAAWPERSGRGHRAHEDVERVAEHRSEIEEFADKMNAMPKHVVSTTLRGPKWNNSTVIKGDVAGEVTRLKKQEGGPILSSAAGPWCTRLWSTTSLTSTGS